MSIPRRHSFMLVAIILGTMLMLLLSACSSVSVGVKNPTAKSSYTPLQVLQKSTTTMKNLKSAHIGLQSSSNFQVKNQGNSTTAATPTAASIGGNNATVTIQGSGDEALPNQEQLHLTVNKNTNLAEIVQGDKVYIQNAQGQWYVLNKSDFTGLVSNPFSGVNLDTNSMLGLVQHAQITDHGDENVNGQNLRHISATLDKTALSQLLKANPQLMGQVGQQNVNNVLNNTKNFQSTVDVWIDESQFYLHRVQLKVNVTADTNGIEGTAPSTITTALNTTLDLSKFNAPITITMPTNATPTNNPAAIFGDANP